MRDLANYQIHEESLAYELNCEKVDDGSALKGHNGHPMGQDALTWLEQQAEALELIVSSADVTEELNCLVRPSTCCSEIDQPSSILEEQSQLIFNWKAAGRMGTGTPFWSAPKNEVNIATELAQDTRPLKDADLEQWRLPPDICDTIGELLDLQSGASPNGWKPIILIVFLKRLARFEQWPIYC